MYEDVLLPTDGSSVTDTALDHAIDHALTYDATLHTLYVVDTTAGPDAGTAKLFEALEDAGHEAIRTITDRARAAGVGTVEASIGRGAPYRVILDYVTENGVDLVVMGTHGRTGIDRYVLGSTTEKVVRLCDAPVLTVRTVDESEA